MTGSDALEPTWLDAAGRVLATEGTTGFTVERVAAAAGVSRVTLHRRGVRRTQLLTGLLDRAAADVRASLWPVITARLDARERLERALLVLCDVVERHAAILTALYSVVDPGPGGGATSGFDFTEPFERLVLDLGAAPADAATWAEVSVNAVTWTYLHLRRSHRYLPGRARDAVVRLVLASAPAPATSSPRRRV